MENIDCRLEKIINKIKNESEMRKYIKEAIKIIKKENKYEHR